MTENVFFHSSGQTAAAEANFMFQAKQTAPPAKAAVIEIGEDGRRLAILTLQDGKLRYIDTGEENPTNPVWSADGRFLLYRVRNALWLYDSKSDSAGRILEDLTTSLGKAYSFDPNSRSAAAALKNEILIFDADSSPVTESASRRIAIPVGFQIKNLFWTPDGQTLLLYLKDAKTNSAAHLMVADALTGKYTLRKLTDDYRLLGWQNNTHRLVASRYKKADFSEEAGFLAANGDFQPINIMDNDESREFIVDFLPKTGVLVFTGEREDTSDPQLFRLISIKTLSSQPWLGKYPQPEDLSFSNDGAWAMFVKPLPGGDGPGGDVYLVKVGSEEATLVLGSIPEKAFYSFPLPQP